MQAGRPNGGPSALALRLPSRRLTSPGSSLTWSRRAWAAYVCMYVCMRACMHVCMHVSMYVCIIDTQTPTHPHTHTHTNADKHTNTHAHSHAGPGVHGDEPAAPADGAAAFKPSVLPPCQEHKRAGIRAQGIPQAAQAKTLWNL